MEKAIYGGELHSGRPARPLWNAMWNGLRCTCPKCGQGRLFASFLKTVPACASCGERLDHHRADDLPAYLVIVIVGHIVVGAFMGVEATTNLSTLAHMAIWTPLTVALSLLLLRPVKGAVVGLQWALSMHGFGGEEDSVESHPEL